MGAGKATGAAREYQELCRDILMRRFGGTPYSGDGLDVPFEAAGTTFHMDVALNGGGLHAGSLVLVECRKTKSKQKQNALAAFAFEVESIREVAQRPVAAFFMTEIDPQLGAIKLTNEELDLGGVVVVRGTTLTDAQVAFVKFDRERKRKLHHHLLLGEGGKYVTKGGNVRFTVSRADGSVETSRDDVDD